MPAPARPMFLFFGGICVVEYCAREKAGSCFLCSLTDFLCVLSNGLRFQDECGSVKGKLKGRLQDHRERIEQEEPEAAQEAQSNGEDDEVVFVRSVQKSSSKQPQRGAVAARRQPNSKSKTHFSNSRSPATKFEL